jgi:sulfonate transport system substrate-binding protein
VTEGHGFFAKNLEYSESKSVGAELGMIAASRSAVDNKREAVQRFVWAYMNAQEALASDPAKFAEAYARLTGIDPKIATEAAKVITLGAVVSPEQLERQAKAFSELGVIQKDVSGEIRKNWDASFVAKAQGG